MEVNDHVHPGSSRATRNASVPTRGMTAKDRTGTRIIWVFLPGRAARLGNGYRDYDQVGIEQSRRVHALVAPAAGC